MKLIRNFMAIAIILALQTGIWASGGGSSSKPLQGTHPIVFSHGLFGWGENSNGIFSVLNYWGGMDNYLRSQGAVVFAPAKSATNSNEVRAAQLKNSINMFMASGGYSKVHILGHSQGGLDARYMISNLGMSSKVSTMTSLNSPHRGSPIADIVKAVLPSWIEPFVGTVTSVLVSIVYGGSSEQDALQALISLTKENMSSFNGYTPNRSGVKYYSYGSHITITDIIQHPLMGPLHPVCGAGGVFQGQGFSNDGLVPVSSQRWGTWKGGPSYPIWVTGVDHLQATNTLNSGKPWYDVEGYYLKMAQNMKSNQ